MLSKIRPRLNMLSENLRFFPWKDLQLTGNENITSGKSRIEDFSVVIDPWIPNHSISRRESGRTSHLRSFPSFVIKLVYLFKFSDLINCESQDGDDGRI